MTDVNEVQILYVEDNPNDAELTMRALRKRNLANKVFHVEDGAQALDFIFARGQFTERDMAHPPRLVLLDIKLPKVDGLEVLRAIKGDPRTKDIPVVMLTSSSEDRDIGECYRLGVNSYIVKPVDFENFAQAVSEAGFYWAVLNKPPAPKA
jgi:CheY-like chemotaxis protein